MKNSEYIKIIAKKLFLKYKQKEASNVVNTIISIAKEQNVDPIIIIAIYLIETYYRQRYKRLGEYIIFLISFGLNKGFKRPIKNYTLGPLQIGISTILFYSNAARYKIHDRLINDLTFKQLWIVLKHCELENNLQICCTSIYSIQENVEKKWGRLKSNVGRIGQIYNGQINYGTLLITLYSEIEAYLKSTVYSKDTGIA